jgi:hypothetical protein
MIKVRYKVALADGEIVDAFDEVEGATICPVCFEVHGRLVVSGRSRRHYRQRCACERGDEPEERWLADPARPDGPRFDFNRLIELCRCCTLEPLPSGSRWSVWFCDACKERALELNRSVGGPLLPIGRHTLMNHVGLSGEAAADPRACERVAAAATTLFERMDALHEWANKRLRENTGGLGFAPAVEVPLEDYLVRAEAVLSKKDAFEALHSFALREW